MVSIIIICFTMGKLSQGGEIAPSRPQEKSAAEAGLESRPFQLALMLLGHTVPQVGQWRELHYLTQGLNLD